MTTVQSSPDKTHASASESPKIHGANFNLGSWVHVNIEDVILGFYIKTMYSLYA
jgi:hypothetical protein